MSTKLAQQNSLVYKLQYKYHLGDKDSACYQTVVTAKPHGPDFLIEKLEYVGHVQKRMCLRKLKTKMGRTSLSDGKTVGGALV